MLAAILDSWAASWKLAGAPLANHLWQSTLFACVAALLALALKRNRAEARYALWLAASLKFLVPFSLVIDLARHLAKPRAAAIAQPAFTLVVQEIGQPFASVSATHIAAPVASSWMATAIQILPTALLLAWVAGCAAVTINWCRRWRRVRAVMRDAMVINSGREFDALRRVSRRAGFPGPIEILLSASTLEPGIVGVLRPVLLLPCGISERLTDEQLDAVLTHELCHAGRRDNLTALIHMLVQAVFWFYPLVWWIDSRLIAERERACDEEVLRLGSRPQDYAEGILKVCEFYLESPLVCAAGVTGSNLKKRIEEIMRFRVPRKLEFGKKLLLATVGVAAVAIPVAMGFANPLAGRPQAPTAAAVATADGVTIKAHAAGDAMSFTGPQPGGWQFTGFTVRQLIAYAYGLDDFQISGGPAWIGSQKYDISLKLSASDVVSPQVPFAGLPPQLLTKVQNLLTDRFGLVFHRETKELTVYAMVVGQDGPKMTEVFLDPQPEAAGGKLQMMQMQTRAQGLPPTPPPLTSPSSLPPNTMWESMKDDDGVDQGKLMARAIHMDILARSLSTMVGSKVVDQTGLEGTYDFTLSWSTDSADHQYQLPSPASVASVLTSVSQQLGLELKGRPGPVDVFVVDKAEEIAGSQ